MRRHARSFLAPGLLLLVATGFSSAAPAPRHKVLLIGIDGVRVDVLERASTPNIDALSDAGAFSATARTRPRTVSGPGWSSMLTGVWMDKHGVTDNHLVDNHYDRFPDFLTRIEQLRPELETMAVLNWPPLGTTASGGPLVSDAVDIKININGGGVGYDVADVRALGLAEDYLRHGDPDAAFVYLGDVDEVGHDTSSLSSEYREAMERADRQVGRLISAVRERATYGTEDWLVLMSTDHGRADDGSHGGTSERELTIFYLASGAGVSREDLRDPVEIVDVAVTALAWLGIDADPAWDLDGHVNGIAR